MKEHLTKKNLSICILAGVFLFLIGCTDGSKNSVNIDEKGWAIEKGYTLDFTVKDTLTKKDLVLRIEHDEEYPFQNIFLRMQLTSPNGRTIADTLEYNLADISGKWLGSGWGKNKTLQLYYKEKIPLQKGNYRLKIWQAMRKRGSPKGVGFLKGIQRIGIHLENN